ncbi:MAG TPA: NAD(P)H-binding protein [Solirubrobacteraceae bacterium]|nr:NAD(P)H-binding protein [Solirubrobacteraceae bacterium]
MANADWILVTGAGGRIGGVGRTVVELLLQRGLPVRAMVHREDERAQALRDLGARVVAGDLSRPPDVANALEGCRRMLFCMSVSPDFLEASATIATVARALGGLEALVNLSQMTVSQMTAVSAGESHQQRLHWLSEQVLGWSALPVVHLRPTIFQENPLFTTVVARSVAERGVLPLPTGRGRTSPVAAIDVARVASAVLQDPGPHIGRVLELTGPRSQDMDGVAEEYSRALGKPVRYVDVPADEWAAGAMADAGLSAHEQQHLITLAALHRQNRFDRMTDTVLSVTGQPAQTIEAFVAQHRTLFTLPDRAAA